MSLLSGMVLGLLVLAACERPPMKTVALGDTGYVIDVPGGWVVEVPMKGFFELSGRPSPQIMVKPVPASSADVLVKSVCGGDRGDIKQESLPGGGAFASCTGPSQMIKGATTTMIIADIPIDDHSAFTCHLETDKDPELASKICKSIRKQK